MEWCIVIGIAGRIIVIKIGPGRPLLVKFNSDSEIVTERSSERTICRDINPYTNGQWSHGGSGSIVTFCQGLVDYHMLLYVCYAGICSAKQQMNSCLVA